MISHRFPFLLLFIASLFLNAQEYQKQIQLHPDIGDTLDLFEKNFFDLYPNIAEFQFATFERQNEKQVKVTITYLNNGISINQVANYKDNQLTSVRDKIQKNSDKYDCPLEIRLVRVDGDRSTAKLMMFDTNYVYFKSEISDTTDEASFYKIPIADIDSIVVLETGVGISPILLGLLIGGGVGALVGLAYPDNPDSFIKFSPETKAGIFAALLGGVGLIVGIIIETIIPSNNQSIDEDQTIWPSKMDFVSALKEYGMYNFGNNKELMSKYKLLD